MKPIIPCPYCKKDFEQARPNKQYCSTACKKSASGKRNKSGGFNTERNRLRKRPYTKYKKDRCEFCGFIPVHPCQLDVDHINGDHSDHREENLQTLCANCHRLKTFLCKDNHNTGS